MKHRQTKDSERKSRKCRKIAQIAASHIVTKRCLHWNEWEELSPGSDTEETVWLCVYNEWLLEDQQINGFRLFGILQVGRQWVEDIAQFVHNNRVTLYTERKQTEERHYKISFGQTLIGDEAKVYDGTNKNDSKETD